MAYTDDLLRSGRWLFRWRSYLPLLLLAFVLFELRDFTFLGGSQHLDQAWEALCLGVSLCGLAVRAHVVGHAPARTSGRNTRSQIADALNTSGLYSLVRHPLYVGNLLMWLGVVMFLHDLQLVLLTVAVYWLYYERIVVAEEQFLRERFGPVFEHWARHVPAFVPRRWAYVRPELPFSWRTVLQREYSGLFAVVALPFLLEVLGDLRVEGRVRLEAPWVVLLASVGAIYLGCRWLKKRTAWLQVEGR